MTVDLQRLTGARVSVVGLGREGLAVARVLAGEGASVTVADRRDAAALAPQRAALAALGDRVRLVLGEHGPDDLLPCDLLVLSPGVDKRQEVVWAAQRQGIPISSETDLFLRRCPAPVIGITGSSGKTTTTTLVGEMLRQRADGAPVFVGGNIGTPLLERLPEITPQAQVVLELSSFQLEWLPLSPAIAVVTNITPNHLDRHDTMAAYIAAKAAIVRYQGGDGVAVLNRDDANVAALADQTTGRVLYFSLIGPVDDGAYATETHLVLRQGGYSTPLCRIDDLRVPGRHNVYNALAAATVAQLRGVAVERIAAVLRAFRGVAHRLQPLATVAAVTYYDDSIATSPERTLAALAALDRPVVLILGGHDKRLPWEALAYTAARRCRGIVLIGEAAPLIRRQLEAALAAASGDRCLDQAAIVDRTTMAAAVQVAATLAQGGDAVVLSPGCASYDMYRDYEERGDDFAEAVGRLIDARQGADT